MRPVSLRAKFVRDLALMLVVTGAVNIVILWFANRRAVHTLSASIIRQTLQTIERELDSFFNPVTFSLEVAASWSAEGALDLETRSGPFGDQAGFVVLRRRMTERFIPVMEQLPRLSSLLVADETGREFMLLRTDAGFEAWQTFVQDDGSLLRRRTWSDHGADLTVSRIDYDPRHRPWFTGAIAAGTGEVYWTEPYTFFTTGQPGISASIAARTPGGLTQVIGFDVLLRDISEFTRSLRVTQRGKVVVMTTDDLVVGLPNDPRFDDPQAREAALLKGPDELGLELARDATQAFGDAVVQAIEQQRDPQEMTVRFRSLGEAWWGESRLFSLAPTRHLRMAVIVPESELLGNLIYQRLVIAAALLAVLLVGLWRTIVLGRTLSRPVEQLVGQTDRIGQGDLSPAPAIRTDISEVRRIAAAHDRMRRSLQNLMKLERDIQIARQIQQSTMPHALPALDGFEIAAWNEPADETGGDTFDVIGLPDRSTGADALPHGRAAAPTARGEHTAPRAVLLLADATGHGIGPALAATQIRAMLRMALRLGSDLPQIARHLNEQLVADLPDNRFITAWMGEVDARAGTLTSFSAGQGPLLLYRAAARTITHVPTDAPPFGVTPDLIATPAAAVRMERGDVFAVLSDGLFEARNAAGEQFGLDRVEAVLTDAAADGADAIIAALRAAVESFTSSAAADDDRTIIVIRRTR
ncbi:MAG: SpoIIE family protein phosphatase [Phycisphaerales bacterium]|nr:SpoIIE family protein phosphatase [Phycisphaerales bacterium]